MDRSASTICRELKRNAGAQLGYQPAYAEEQTWARRWRGSRLARQPELRERVLQRLAKGQSPEQVAGRLRLEQGRAVLSAESIYRFIYAQIRRTDDTDWRNYLPRRKYKRGYRRPARDRSPLNLIPQRVPLAQRLAEVLQRSEGGHWEADLMVFQRTRSGAAGGAGARFAPAADPPPAEQSGYPDHSRITAQLRPAAAIAAPDRHLR